MALEAVQAKYIPNDNNFYRDYYHYFIYVVMLILVIALVCVGVLLYQVTNRPLPTFVAVEAKGEQMLLTPFQEPNILPDTILRFASKAAITAYTFVYVNYDQELKLARPYFTEAGWQDYLRSVNNVINTIVKNKLIINGVVSGTPVISNQGPLPGKGYTWRVQIPFLVTYQSANITTQTNYTVVITIVKVPTSVNPQGIGIDQFVMVT